MRHAFPRLRHIFADAAYAVGKLQQAPAKLGLRYIAAAVLYELGCGWRTIASITGHETAEMVRQYTEKQRQARIAVNRVALARHGGEGQS